MQCAKDRLFKNSRIPAARTREVVISTMLGQEFKEKMSSRANNEVGCVLRGFPSFEGVVSEHTK